MILPLLVLLLAAAQAPPPDVPETVTLGSPFTLGADHVAVPPDATVSYRLYRNGVVVATKPYAANTTGVISFDEPGTLPEGRYTYVLAAVYPTGELQSAPHVVTIVAPVRPPSAPIHPRILVLLAIGPDGSIIATPQAFAAGDRVQTVPGGTLARVSPLLTAEYAQHLEGEFGTITGGPAPGSGYTWWLVDYDTGIDGWSDEGHLTLVTK